MFQKEGREGGGEVARWQKGSGRGFRGKCVKQEIYRKLLKMAGMMERGSVDRI